MRWALGTWALAIVCACGGGSERGAAIDGLVSIRVEPTDQTLVIDGKDPATAEYRAFGTFDDGSESEITDRVLFTAERPGIGAFSGALFESSITRGGDTSVVASAGSINGYAALSLLLRQIQNDPASSSLPADPGSLFGGSDDPGRAPTLVYPADGVLVPPNLSQLEFHFYPGNANSVFELRFENRVTDVTVYLDCTNALNSGCIYAPDATVWEWIAETNRGGVELDWTIRGTGAGGGTVGASASGTVSFSQDDISGAIYYWTTSGDTAIMRYDTGAGQGSAQEFISTDLTDGNCVGCHALSRDGEKMVTATNGSTGANVLLLDVANEAPMVPYDSTPRSAFSSWSPAGDSYVGVWGGSGSSDFDLRLYDGDTGVHLSSIDVGGTTDNMPNHPDWSPNGDQIAYANMDRTGNSLAQNVFAGAIEVVTESAGVWSAPETIVATEAGKNHYYPAFSPDGSYLVYNQSTCDGAPGSECDAYEDPSARLYMVAASAGNTPVELANANAPGVADGGTDLTSSFPKWSPFVFQRTGEFGSRLMWLTFSSTRTMGLRDAPSGGTLIWMTGVDPDAVSSGTDPSYPAFALPFQDLTTSNHTAQWTTKLVTIE